MALQIWKKIVSITGLVERSPAAERAKDSHLLLESMIPILGLYGIGPGYLDPQWLHDEQK
ncbi:hypothetical protein [Tatumella citrea]|uniref:Uncharacterized protein n=1 Tax=Tatumella citrea TaxID=53336 RepID=A0A1Y0L7F8_TATCI|nr:hypothetical protein [Tatumella citrea]ARU93953.1 hypothetical protein A7K98_09290 [Tatumella citrea]ARU97991.1 hypothetical protein A7K99_09290 [Tatumella citrea]